MRSQTHILKLAVLGLVLGVSPQSLWAQQTPFPGSAPQSRSFLQPASTDQLRNSQVLGIPTSHCGHVIELLTANRLRRQTGHVGESQVMLPHLTVGLTPGDLELLCVHLVCDGDANQGPVFQIGMKNNSNVPIGNFSISLVGVLGQIHMHAPTATVRIDRMEAGEETPVQIQLPVTCMQMGPLHQPCAFDTLIVALDSFDDLLECNELNNVQILPRGQIDVLVAGSPVPTDLVETTPEPPAAAGPGEEVSPSPLEGLDLDNLGLEETQNLRLRHR